MKRSIFIILSIALLFSSCRVHFNENLKTSITKQNIDLKKIQYYNSKKIELTRIVNSSDTKVEGGKVKLENGKYVETIVIKAKTAGICDSISGNKMYVRFENGDNRSLCFYNQNPNDSYGVYKLKGENCRKVERNYTITSENNTQVISADFYVCNVQYEGKTYEVKYSQVPILLIKKKHSYTKKTKKRKAKGVKVK